MSAAVHHLFAVRETDPTPFAIPAPPGRTATYAVSISGTFAYARIVEASRSRIPIDPQTRNYNAGGIRRQHPALANLPLETASEFRDLPNQAIAVAAEARLLPIGFAGCGAAHDANPPVEHVSATASPRLPFWYRHRMPKMKSKSPTIRFVRILMSQTFSAGAFFVG